MRISKTCGQGGALGGSSSLDIGVLLTDCDKEIEERGIHDLLIKAFQAFGIWITGELANLLLLTKRDGEKPQMNDISVVLEDRLVRRRERWTFVVIKASLPLLPNSERTAFASSGRRRIVFKKPLA